MSSLAPARLLGLCCCALFLLSSCQLGRFVVYNFADIKDYKKFPDRPLVPDGPSFSFHTTETGKKPRQVTGQDGKAIPFDQFLADQKTVAFLIIRNDTIQYEQYFRDYDSSSIVPSFSMAKSVTSILIGCAIEDGLIGSVDDTVSHYLPEMAANGYDRVTLKHLLQMTAGVEFLESYRNPFGHAASFYYGRKLRKETLNLTLQREPGQSFAYNSGAPQILGLILDRVLGEKTVTAYLQERIWTPLGMEYAASWSIDRRQNGLEKTFCCLNARARDFAKIGRLYLKKGNWNGQQILPQEWVVRSTAVDTTEGSAAHYQYQWWLPSPDGDFMAEGILGQYTYVNPAKNLIIVRLGKNYGKVNWEGIFTSVSKLY